MFSLVAFVLVPLIAALPLMKARLHRTVIFFVSSLLAAYVTLGIQPWLTSLLLQNVPEPFQVWCPLISLPGVFILLLAGLMTVLNATVVPARADYIKYPEKAANAVSAVCIFCGMFALCGVLWLGVSALPHIDKVPVLNRREMADIGRKAAFKCISAAQFGTPPTENQRIWFSIYPDIMYISNGGSVDIPDGDSGSAD